MRDEWLSIKNEYVTTSISYRDIRDKYKVSMRAITDRAKAEDWKGLREQFKAKATTRAMTVAVRNVGNRVERIYTVTDKILDTVEEALVNIHSSVIKKKTTDKSVIVDEDGNDGKPQAHEVTEVTEQLLYQDGFIDIGTLKALSSIIKDIKEIQMLKTVLDEEEQKARIKKIETDIAKTTGPEDTEGTGLLILPEVKEGEDNDQDDTPEIEI